jgi:hypothetical protein
MSNVSPSPSLMNHDDSPSRRACSSPSSDMFIRDDESRQVYRMMVIADKTLLPHSMMVNLVRDPNIRNRTCMVEWMMKEVRICINMIYHA